MGNPLFKWVQVNWFQKWRAHWNRNRPLEDFWYLLMRTGKRKIYYARSKQSVSIPFPILIENRPVEGIKAARARRVKEGRIVTVRSDADEPYIEIETAHAVFRSPSKEEGNAFIERYFSIRS